jgi:hypothetical protein
MPFIEPVPTPAVLTIFSNVPAEHNLPHIRELVAHHLSLVSPVTHLALSHTCTLYRNLCTRPLTPNDLVFDVRDPSKVYLWRRAARKLAVQNSKGERWCVKLKRSKPTVRELKMVVHKGPTFSCYAFE